MGRTEKQLADAVSAEVHISVRAGRDFLRRLLELVADDLVDTGRLELRGLGTFAVSDRKARRGKHPKTGKPIRIKASRFVRYRTSVRIRRRLNPKSPAK